MLVLEWRFGRPDGANVALEQRFVWPDDAKLSLKRCFGRCSGVETALERPDAL